MSTRIKILRKVFLCCYFSGLASHSAFSKARLQCPLESHSMSYHEDTNRRVLLPFNIQTYGIDLMSFCTYLAPFLQPVVLVCKDIFEYLLILKTFCVHR